MANETLSMKQAKQIVERANEIISHAATKMVEKNDEFVEKISNVWEDQNAVDYMKTHKTNFEGFITELRGNSNIFADTVKEIATAYAKAGGMAVALAVAGAPLAGIIFAVDKVREHFANSENDDDFGFKNPENGAEQVMDAFQTLKSELERITSDAVNQIKSINAFGNQQVQLNLAKSAGKIVEILQEHISASESQIRTYVDQTAQAYIKLGVSAVASANLSSNN